MLNRNIVTQDTGVNFGDGVSVSMQTVQHIYNKITGKTEQLQKTYDIAHKASFEDVQQLHAKICQTCEQYNITSANHSVEVFHSDDQKQIFSTFDRFKLFDKSNSSAVENIRLKYNFLIILPQTAEPQSYVIDINVHSRAAILDRSDRDIGLGASLWSAMAISTGNLKISYVDFTVAKNFQNVIDGWFSSLDHEKPNPSIQFLQSKSRYFAYIFSTIMTSAFLYALYRLSNLGQSSASISALYQNLIITFGGAMILWSTGRELGRLAERSVDRIFPVSYLHLTKGDERIWKKQLSENRKHIGTAIISIVIALTINIASSFIAKYFGV